MRKVLVLLCAIVLFAACGNEDGKTSQPSKPQGYTPPSQNLDENLYETQKYYALGAYIGSFLKQQSYPLNIERFEAGVRDGFSGNCKKSREEIEKLLQKYNTAQDSASASYWMGTVNGLDFLKFELDADIDNFVKGLNDQLNGICELPQDQLQQINERFNREILDKANEKKSAENAEFLAKNKSAKGVVETASGLQYKVLKAGKGNKPAATDSVKVNYTGKLVDGTVFDASANHGGPATFQLNQVIPGWTEGLQLMSPGSKYELYIPANLGYGEQGIPNVIPGGSTLIFEVELLEINPAK